MTTVLSLIEKFAVGKVLRIAAPALLVATLSGSSLADERTFEEHCARCHHRANSLARRFMEQTVEERSAALDRFLETHHAQDPKVRAAVIEYLMGLWAR